MTWFKVDDSFSSHPKVMAIPRGAARLRAIGLWASLGSWCARQLTDGHFARHMVTEHGGTTSDAKRLVEVGLWETTPAGYVFHDWQDWQPTRAKVEEDRAAARERMRRNRTGSPTPVRPNTGRTSEAVTPTPSRPVPSSAAAAADGAAAAADPAGSDDDLPGPLAVFRSKLQAHTALAALRFDSLTPAQVDELSALVELHGDDRLAAVARDTCRNPAPIYVTAFLGSWRALPPPGQRLAAVQRLCDTHSTVLTGSGICNACAADQKAAR